MRTTLLFLSMTLCHPGWFTGWRRAKRKNGKWREWDSGYIAERYALGRAKATIKLALEQRTLELWEETASSEHKPAGNCTQSAQNPPKKHAKVTQRSLQSGQCPDCTDENGKNRSQKVLALQKRARIRLPGVPVDRMPDAYPEKKQDVNGGQQESGLWKNKFCSFPLVCFLIRPHFVQVIMEGPVFVRPFSGQQNPQHRNITGTGEPVC